MDYELLERSSKIVNVVLFMDIVIFFFGLFNHSKLIFLSSILFNIVFIGAYLIIQKYSLMFLTISKKYKMDGLIKGRAK